MLNFMNAYTGNQTGIQIDNNYAMSYYNYYDEGWGQHIAIDNDYNGNKYSFFNLGMKFSDWLLV